jgi:pimeloyl-ACP methyl ester carboxylesterase
MLDFDIYGKTFKYLAEHDASDVLDKIACPVLLLSGDKDLFTPTSLAREMARRIPGAELMVIKGGSHYAPVEFPELVNLRIEKFINERLHDFVDSHRHQ